MMEDSDFQKLKQFLTELPPGQVPSDKEGELIKLLGACWDMFNRDDHGDIDAYKLNRMEDPTWEPPILSFTMERHGAMAFSSTRAELQHWAVDVESREVGNIFDGYRQAIPRQAPVYVEPIAEELAKLIINRSQDERLKWSPHGRVQVLASKIFQTTFPRQTYEGRCGRLNKCLEEILAPHSWRRKGSWWRQAGT